MLIWLIPNVSLSKAAQFLKGGSSRILRKEFPELEAFLWAGLTHELHQSSEPFYKFDVLRLTLFVV